MHDADYLFRAHRKLLKEAQTTAQIEPDVCG
jgi:hypothetical protein